MISFFTLYHIFDTINITTQTKTTARQRVASTKNPSRSGKRAGKNSLPYLGGFLFFKF